MSIKEFKTVIRERLSPEIEKAIEESKKSKVVAEKTNDVVFEYESHGNFFLVRRYEVVYRGSKYHCFCNLHLCCLSDNDSNRLEKLKELMPDKFLFKNLVHLEPLKFDDETILNRYCDNRTVPFRDEVLGESSRSNAFNDRVNTFLVRWSVINKDTLILAPSDWVYGVIKNVKGIAQMMRNSGLEENWGDVM